MQYSFVWTVMRRVQCAEAILIKQFNANRLFVFQNSNKSPWKQQPNHVVLIVIYVNYFVLLAGENW